MADRTERSRILDEFVGLSGFHRKHAMRLLRENGRAPPRRARRRIYDEAERNALMLLWEAADRVCGKRLKALLGSAQNLPKRMARPVCKSFCVPALFSLL
jgi:hypothetical protein